MRLCTWAGLVCHFPGCHSSRLLTPHTHLQAFAASWKALLSFLGLDIHFRASFLGSSNNAQVRIPHPTLIPWDCSVGLHLTATVALSVRDPIVYSTDTHAIKMTK
jgi:hypothetical protein